MDYIFKSDFLNFSNNKKQNNLQYLHWTQKKRLEKQKSEYQSIIKQWQNISQEEKDSKKKIQSKVSKQKLPQEKPNITKPDDLYQKHLDWKNNVEMKIAKIRMEQKEEQQRKEKLVIQQSRIKQKVSEGHQNYKGPIKAWKQRFQSYLKAKSGQPQQQLKYFHPNINKNSRLITNKMVGKVEDRLIQYGERLKQKKAEMQIIYEEELFLQRNTIKDQSLDSNIEQVYWRLYKDGEKYNKKRNTYKSQYTFVPEINKNSALIAEKNAQKRKPLHQQFKSNTPNKIQDKQISHKKQRQNRQKSFDDFLKRNDVLLTKIQKHKHKKMEQIKQKQKKQIQQCTFKPNLNQKSLQLFSSKSNQKQNNNNNNNPHQQQRYNINSNQSLSYDSGQNHLKKQYFVRSQNNDFLDQNKQLQTTQRQRISRLNSDGNIYTKNEIAHIYIGEQDSISNIHNRQYQPISNSMWDSLNKRTTDRQRQISQEQQLFATDRYNDKGQIYHIREVMEEDSIQKSKEDDWQNQLLRMQKQIQNMMHRTPTK